MHSTVYPKLRGTVIIEEVDRKTGLILKRRKWHNSIQSSMRAAISAALADDPTGVPATIALLKGTINGTDTYDAIASADHDAELGATGQLRLAQQIAVNQSFAWRGILAPMKRLGSSAGNLYWEVYSDNAGAPDTLLVTTSTIAVNALPTASYEWKVFPFATTYENNINNLDNTGGQYHIVLRSSGYTYSSGVTEVMLGVDSSSPGYTLSQLKKYDGATWSNYSPTADLIWRTLHGPDSAGQSATLSQLNAITSKAITSKSRQSSIIVRYLAQFTEVEALDYIAGLALCDNSSSQNVIAWANVDYDKSLVTSALNVYWLLEVLSG